MVAGDCMDGNQGNAYITNERGSLTQLIAQLHPGQLVVQLHIKDKMGIFSNWRIFTKPEILLEEHIRQNPFHPFHLLGEGSADEPSADQMDVRSTHSPSGKQ